MNESQKFLDDTQRTTNGIKRSRSLERIKEACEELQRINNGSEFTIADVGRFCQQKWGGPKAQSIRNSKDILEKYVKLFLKDNVILSERSSSDKIEDVLAFSNPAVAQHQYTLAQSKIKELKAEVFRLRSDVDRYHAFSSDELLDSIKGPRQNEVYIQDFSENYEGVKNVIISLFNPEKLRSCELKIDGSGYLINEVTGNSLLSPAEVAILMQLVDVAVTKKRADSKINIGCDSKV